MTHLLRPMLGSALLVLAASSSACRSASRANAESDAQPETTVSVQNQDFLDMDVYVVRVTQRIRLGTAPGHNTTVLKIPESLVIPGVELQFLCDPIGGNRAPVSERITVFPGDQLVLIINTGN
jgi:hypothetical protein